MSRSFFTFFFRPNSWDNFYSFNRKRKTENDLLFSVHFLHNHIPDGPEKAILAGRPSRGRRTSGKAGKTAAFLEAAPLRLTNILQMERVMAYQKGRREKVYLWLGILAGILLGLGGCASGDYFGIGNTPGLTEPKIQAGPPENFVTSRNYALRRSRIAVLPFRVPAQVTDVSYSITEVFHRQLLEQRPFLGVIRVYEYYNTLGDAQKLAKAQGADLFLVGEVPYFLDSGTTGKSGIQIDLKVVETSTGHTLWYLSDTISAQPAPIIDLWVIETKPKPSPSIYFLVDALSERMCQALLRDLLPPENQAANPGSRYTSQK